MQNKTKDTGRKDEKKRQIVRAKTKKVIILVSRPRET